MPSETPIPVPPELLARLVRYSERMYRLLERLDRYAMQHPGGERVELIPILFDNHALMEDLQAERPVKP